MLMISFWEACTRRSVTLHSRRKLPSISMPISGEASGILSLIHIYAGNVRSLDGTADSPAYRFLHADVRDAALMRNTLREYGPAWVMHLAANAVIWLSLLTASRAHAAEKAAGNLMLPLPLLYARLVRLWKKIRILL